MVLIVHQRKCAARKGSKIAGRIAAWFVGVEREPKYFDISCQRIENAYRQERLFA